MKTDQEIENILKRLKKITAAEVKAYLESETANDRNRRHVCSQHVNIETKAQEDLLYQGRMAGKWANLDVAAYAIAASIKQEDSLNRIAAFLKNNDRNKFVLSSNYHLETVLGTTLHEKSFIIDYATKKKNTKLYFAVDVESLLEEMIMLSLVLQ